MKFQFFEENFLKSSRIGYTKKFTFLIPIEKSYWIGSITASIHTFAASPAAKNFHTASSVTGNAFKTMGCNFMG